MPKLLAAFVVALALACTPKIPCEVTLTLAGATYSGHCQAYTQSNGPGSPLTEIGIDWGGVDETPKLPSGGMSVARESGLPGLGVYRISDGAWAESGGAVANLQANESAGGSVTINISEALPPESNRNDGYTWVIHGSAEADLVGQAPDGQQITGHVQATF